MEIEAPSAVEDTHQISGSENSLWGFLTTQIPIFPLITFRILFGFIMLVSIIRFAWKGWIYELYIEPQFFFPFLGFEWVQPLGDPGMYLLFAAMGLAALGIMVGFFYRLSASVFFLSFTYVELIDKTNYLNHYYFVSIIAFLLILLPAHRAYSIDSGRNPRLSSLLVPRWTIDILKYQLAIVYIFAGLAKLHPDWLFDAQPMKLWLTAKTHLPLIGPFLQYEETAYFFSWFGALYDLFIVFFLLYRPTRPWAYLAVIAFHLMTWWLFPIGMFPFIMILATTIFFSADFHQRILEKIGGKIGSLENPFIPKLGLQKWGLALVGVHLCIQLLLPFRYLLYPGNLFWTEEGYRFSWRVMLMEKAGHAQFKVSDVATGKSEFVPNYLYLTPNQEKMMSTQPDMILQYAHFLAEEYKKKGFDNPEVKVESYVTLNGRRSRPFIDPSVDLASQPYTLGHRKWVLPFEPQ